MPFNVKEEWVKSLQTSLKNTAISIYSGKKKLYDDWRDAFYAFRGQRPYDLSASASIKQSLIKQPL